jgi:hypothetical protein
VDKKVAAEVGMTVDMVGNDAVAEPGADEDEGRDEELGEARDVAPVDAEDDKHSDSHRPHFDHRLDLHRLPLDHRLENNGLLKNHRTRGKGHSLPESCQSTDPRRKPELSPERPKGAGGLPTTLFSFDLLFYVTFSLVKVPAGIG